MDAKTPYKGTIALTRPGASRAGRNHSRRFVRALATAALLLAGSLQPAQATTVPETNLATLVAQSDTVVLADILGTRSDWTGSGAQRRIATYVRVRVIESVKGSALGEFELDFTGGTVGDETLRVSGMPQLKPGTRELIFVNANGAQLCPLVSFWHGRLKVWRGSDATDDRIYRHDGKVVMQLTDIGRSKEKDATGPQLENNVQAGMKVTELLGVLRAEVAAQKEGK